jgi:hypothetical protein
MDSYTIYRQWCIDHGQVPPSREWWDMACNQRRRTIPIDDVNWEIENERREGWTHDTI